MSKIIGNSLTPELIELFNKEMTTVVLSTVTAEGFPHSMPVHLMIAHDEKTVRIALVKSHKTVENIKNGSKGMITVLEGTDFAMGILGSTKIIREPMEGNSSMCMVEFTVEEIKSDTTPTVMVVEGVHTVHRSTKTGEFFRTMFDELYKG